MRSQYKLDKSLFDNMKFYINPQMYEQEMKWEKEQVEKKEKPELVFKNERVHRNEHEENTATMEARKMNFERVNKEFAQHSHSARKRGKPTISPELLKAIQTTAARKKKMKEKPPVITGMEFVPNDSETPEDDTLG